MGSDVLARILHPDDVTLMAAHHRDMRELADGEVLEIEYRMRHAEGGWRTLRGRDVVFARDDDGAVTQIIGTAHDVTRQRAAERELQRLTERLEATVMASPLAIVAAGEDRLVQLWNPAAAAIFGWTAAEVLGRELPVIPPELLPQAEALQRRLAAGEQFSGLDLPCVRKDGERIHTSLSLALMRGAQGEPDSALMIFEDVTERRANVVRLARLTRLYEVLSAVTEAIPEERDAERLFEKVCRIVVEQGGFRRAWVGRKRRNGLVQVAASFDAAGSGDDVADLHGVARQARQCGRRARRGPERHHARHRDGSADGRSGGGGRRRGHPLGGGRAHLHRRPSRHRAGDLLGRPRAVRRRGVAAARAAGRRRRLRRPGRRRGGRAPQGRAPARGAEPEPRSSGWASARRSRGAQRRARGLQLLRLARPARAAARPSTASARRCSRTTATGSTATARGLPRPRPRRRPAHGRSSSTTCSRSRGSRAREHRPRAGRPHRPRRATSSAELRAGEPERQVDVSVAREAGGRRATRACWTWPLEQPARQRLEVHRRRAPAAHDRVRRRATRTAARAFFVRDNGAGFDMALRRQAVRAVPAPAQRRASSRAPASAWPRCSASSTATAAASGPRATVGRRRDLLLHPAVT